MAPPGGEGQLGEGLSVSGTGQIEVPCTHGEDTMAALSLLLQGPSWTDLEYFTVISNQPQCKPQGLPSLHTFTDCVPFLTGSALATCLPIHYRSIGSDRTLKIFTGRIQRLKGHSLTAINLGMLIHFNMATRTASDLYMNQTYCSISETDHPKQPLGH